MREGCVNKVNKEQAEAGQGGGEDGRVQGGQHRLRGGEEEAEERGGSRGSRAARRLRGGSRGSYRGGVSRMSGRGSNRPRGGR